MRYLYNISDFIDSKKKNHFELFCYITNIRKWNVIFYKKCD